MTRRKTSFELFTGIWNLQQNMITPAVHKRIAAWLARQARSRRKRLLLMAFRGCGKSTMVGLFCAWLLYHDPELRILIVAADEALAENMLRHIRHIIESHPLARHLVPQQKQLWANDRLIVERQRVGRDPSIRAAGLYSNLTGMRADIIICDDVEVPKTCDTHLKREQMRNRLRELDFVLVPDGMMIYIGTPHSEDSIYKKDGFLVSYKRLAIRLAPDVWPERFSEKTIALLQQTVGPRAFASQMLLQPMALEQARLDPDFLPVYDGDDLSGMASASCYWDPAFGHQNGDNSVIALVLFDQNDHAFLHDLHYLRVAPNSPTDAATSQCKDVVAFLQRYAIRHLRVEGNGLGQFLPGLLRRCLRSENHACGLEVIHNTTNKNQRILQAFEPRMAAQALSVHRRVMATEFPHEMRLWKADTAHNQDDALDAVAGALLHHKPRSLSRPQYFLQQEE